MKRFNIISFALKSYQKKKEEEKSIALVESLRKHFGF